jgi:hypothetical protein
LADVAIPGLRGLENEFERFRKDCLEGFSDEDVRNSRLVYFAGAYAATYRLLSILFLKIPDKKKHALFRRIAREMKAFQKEVEQAAAAVKTK